MEVLEVDGAAPAPRPVPVPDPGPQRSWQTWQGRVRKLDARWWPLWIVLGVIALFLILTVGVFLGAILLVMKLVGGLVGSVLRLFGGGGSSTGTSLR